MATARSLSTRNWLVYGALGIGAYLLYRALEPLAAGLASAGSAAVKGVQSATGSVSSAIARAIMATGPAGITLAPSVATAGVVLPDGREIPFVSVAAAMTPTADGSAMQFTYQGMTYQTLGPADETNTIYTQAVQ